MICHRSHKELTNTMYYTARLNSKSQYNETRLACASFPSPSYHRTAKVLSPGTTTRSMPGSRPSEDTTLTPGIIRTCVSLLYGRDPPQSGPFRASHHAPRTTDVVLLNRSYPAAPYERLM